MARAPFNWDDAFNELARTTREGNDKAEAGSKAKAEAERQRHIELGWITEDGEPGPNAPQNADDSDAADEQEEE